MLCAVCSGAGSRPDGNPSGRDEGIRLELLMTSPVLTYMV